MVPDAVVVNWGAKVHPIIRPKLGA